MPKIKLGTKSINIPQSRFSRILIGAGLIIGGLLGFLPILGFWMLPLGLIVLSYDSPVIRRMRRKLEVRILRYFKRSS